MKNSIKTQRIIVTVISLTILCFSLLYLIPSKKMSKATWEWISIPSHFFIISIPVMFIIGIFFASKFKEIPLVKRESETEFDDYTDAQNWEHYDNIFKNLWLKSLYYGLSISVFYLLFCYLGKQICFENTSLVNTFILMILCCMSSFYVGFIIFPFLKNTKSDITNFFKRTDLKMENLKFVKPDFDRKRDKSYSYGNFPSSNEPGIPYVGEEKEKNEERLRREYIPPYVERAN